MRIISIIICLLTAATAPVRSQQYKQLTDVPTIYIETANSQRITSKDDYITCRLTYKDGKSQGTITYQPSQSATVYYCAEVAFSPEVKSATGISRLRYVLFDRWPEDGNGFLKDILDNIKQ